MFKAEVRNSVKSTASDRLESKGIYTIHKMTSDGSITTLLTLDLHVPKLSPRCIHSSHINGDLLIGSSNNSYPRAGRVMRCDGTGRKISNIELNEEEERLYKYPKYITENKMNGDIVVSDEGNRALVVVDRSGRHRFDYKCHSTYRSFYPRGVCDAYWWSIEVLMMMTGWNFGVISLLDHDGQFLTRILPEPIHRGQFVFRSLCVDDKNNIYVGFDDKIKVFR